MDKWRGLSRTAIEPEPLAIELSDLRLRLGIESSDTTDDTLLSGLTLAAQSYLRNLLGIEFSDSTWTVSYDCLPMRSDRWWDGIREGAVSDLYGEQRYLECPVSPLQSVTSITFYDTANNPNVVDSSIYYVDTLSNPGRAVLNFGQTWPSNVLRPAAGIEIVFVAGYGTSDPLAIPADLREALLAMVAYLFEHRGACDAATAYTRSAAKMFTSAYHRRRPTL